MIDLRLLRRRSLATANLAAMASSAALFGVLILLPFYLTAVLGFAPVQLALGDHADRRVVHARRPARRPRDDAAWGRSGSRRRASWSPPAARCGLGWRPPAPRTTPPCCPGSSRFGVGLAMSTAADHGDGDPRRPGRPARASPRRCPTSAATSAAPSARRMLGAILHAHLPAGARGGARGGVGAGGPRAGGRRVPLRAAGRRGASCCWRPSPRRACRAWTRGRRGRRPAGRPRSTRRCRGERPPRVAASWRRCATRRTTSPWPRSSGSRRPGLRLAPPLPRPVRRAGAGGRPDPAHRAGHRRAGAGAARARGDGRGAADADRPRAGPGARRRRRRVHRAASPSAWGRCRSAAWRARSTTCAALLAGEERAHVEGGAAGARHARAGGRGRRARCRSTSRAAGRAGPGPRPPTGATGR